MATASEDATANNAAADSSLLVQPPTDQEKELGCKATEEFAKKDYEACQVTIAKLLVTRPNDPKVLHNKAVVEYYSSGLRNYDAFMTNLNKVCAMRRLNMNAVEAVDDVDQCVIYYNHAVMLYHGKKYAEALAVMEALYQFVEPVAEEQLTRKSMCLLVDLYICLNQPEKALEVISDIEKLLSQSTKAAGERESATGAAPAAAAGKDVKESKAEDDSAAVTEAWRLKTILYKIQCCLACKSLKLCKRELKSLGSTIQPNAVYMKANYEYLRGNSLKAMRLLNSAAPAPANSQAPARSLADVAPAMHYNNLGCVHAQLRKNHLASFYFRKALSENENLARELRLDFIGHSPTGRPLYSLATSRHFELLHNAGIQLLHSGRPLPAFDCLIEAVKVYSNNPRLWLRIAECCIMAHRKNNDEDRSLESRRRVIESVVGSGIHRKIILGTAKSDTKVTMESAAIPAATLQFAGLCLQNALHLLAVSSVSSSDATANSTGSGSFGGSSAVQAALDQSGQSGSSGSPSSIAPQATAGADGFGIPSAGSAVAGGHSHAGGSVAQGNSATASTGAVGSNRLGDRLYTAAPPSSPMKANEVLQLKCSVLANSAYVSLCLGDYLLALRHAEALMAMPCVSPAHRYVAQMYAAEANMRMDMIAEAIQRLLPDSITDLSLLASGTSEAAVSAGGNAGTANSSRLQAATMPTAAECDSMPGTWIPTDVAKAKAIMSYNLAVCYAVRGEYDKAGACLAQCVQSIGIPPPTQVYSLRLYLNLVEGKRKSAHAIIKEHFGHVTPNRM